jgi:hypothetical protein
MSSLALRWDARREAQGGGPVWPRPRTKSARAIDPAAS